jgi:WD40-like Beta Propeller Repeat
MNYRKLIGMMILIFSLAPPSWAQFTVPRILKHPGQIVTERLDILNSTFRETNINISPDGKYMFFMSGRGGQPWSGMYGTTYKGKPEYDGDIWFSQKVGGKWSFPQCLGANVNTFSGEDEPNISPDGQTVTYQSWRSSYSNSSLNWESSSGPYYQSTLSGNVWGLAKGLGGGITQFFLQQQNLPPAGSLATDGSTLSADGNTFIVAYGKDYDGNMDLYISRKNAYGQWSYLKRLNISTIGDERSPFLAGDGKTLYFASDGYGGWGGLEILKTVINDNDTNGEVVNLGAPFNTWLDDYGFSLTISGNDAYFVREGDIYYANTQDASPELKPESSVLEITGIITSQKTKRGIGASIKILDAQNKVIAQGQSNSYTGEYTLILPLSANKFRQEITKTGFKKEERGVFEVQLKKGLNDVVSNVEMKPLETDQPVVVTPPPKKVDKECAADVGLEEKVLKGSK